jgi:hypothetical protein
MYQKGVFWQGQRQDFPAVGIVIYEEKITYWKHGELNYLFYSYTKYSFYLSQLIVHYAPHETRLSQEELAFLAVGGTKKDGKAFVILPLKVLSNENWGGSKLVSINPFWWTVLPASVLFRAPKDTITRRAKMFSASLVHFDTLSQPVGLVAAKY